jgi:hypothetical protein
LGCSRSSSNDAPSDHSVDVTDPRTDGLRTINRSLAWRRGPPAGAKTRRAGPGRGGEAQAGNAG